MDLSDFRKEYDASVLRRRDLDACPIQQFSKWFDLACQTTSILEPNAMSLATVDESGKPFQRTVLLKQFNSRGFVFFTNYLSRKAMHLERNSQASLLFAWIHLERQIAIQGSVEKISREESEAYFRSRPRESQIGAWVSNQSTPIQTRETLEESHLKYHQLFEGKEVPLPDFWGGFRLKPQSIEFWQGGPGRLHDRFIYQLQQDEAWMTQRLSP